MATITDTEVMELTTTVRFDPEQYPDLGAAAESLEGALLDAMVEESIVTIKAYFVRTLGDVVQVGLRFEGMNSMYVEETADDLLGVALAKLEGGEATTKRTSTTLVEA